MFPHRRQRRALYYTPPLVYQPNPSSASMLAKINMLLHGDLRGGQQQKTEGLNWDTDISPEFITGVDVSKFDPFVSSQIPRSLGNNTPRAASAIFTNEANFAKRANFQGGRSVNINRPTLHQRLQFIEREATMNPYDGRPPLGVLPSLPSYLAAESRLRHKSSTDSDESIRTQAPLPYHLPADQEPEYYGQPPQEPEKQYRGDEYMHRPVVNDGRDHFQQHRSLNPTSMPYYPGGQSQGYRQPLPATHSDGLRGLYNVHGEIHERERQAQAQATSTYNTYNSGSAPYNGQTSQFQQPSYGANNSTYDSGPVYSNYGPGPVTSDYGSFNSSQEYMHPSSNTGSQLSNYSSMTSGQNTRSVSYSHEIRGDYPPVQYGHGGVSSGQDYNRARSSTSYNNSLYSKSSTNNTWGSERGADRKYSVEDFHNDQSRIGGQNTYQSDQDKHNYVATDNYQNDRKYSVQENYHSDARNYGNPENNNQKTVKKQKNDTSRAHYQHSSTYSNRPKSDFGGAVQPPLRSDSVATHRSSPEHRDSHFSDRSDTEAHEDLPTPGPKPYALPIIFGSEPRTTLTPHQRSHSGPSIAPLLTEPSRKATMDSWLADGAKVRQEDSVRGRSPTRTKRASTAGSGILASIDEGDVFVGPPQRPQYNNPFVPSAGLPIGNPSDILRAAKNGMSAQLRALTRDNTIKPNIEDALSFANLPFAEYCRSAKPDNHGVVRIKNIPYSVNRAEVLAFLGRNARIVSEAEFEPVHIVMERVTSKTLDCFVEFVSFQEAVNAVNRFDTNKTGGRGGRLGQRHVEVELSSQDQLLKELFPKAKNVVWQGGRPHIMQTDPYDKYNSGFQGFVSKEELVMLVKHVEAPQRSPFSKDCPQRPFECLISTLLKFPWHMVDCITVADRNRIHHATKQLLALLVDRVHNDRESVHLTPMLLKRAWRAALTCPGFTPSMKDDVVVICGISIGKAIELGLAPHASLWKYLWAIGPKPKAPNDLLMYYIGLIRDATTVCQKPLSLADQAIQGYPEPTEPKLFGDLDKFVNLPADWYDLSLAQIARLEWTAIENVLRRALPPAVIRR